MRLRLVKPARINHEAGEIVEVSSAQSEFLLSVGCAVRVDRPEPVEQKQESESEPETEAKPKTKTTTKKKATK